MLTPRRIAFINEKGGSAKTTLVANLAAYLALKRGRRVLAIDMDPQGQLGKVLGLDVHRTRRSSIDLLLDSVLGDAGLDGTQRREREPERDPVSQLPISRTRIPLLDVVVANKSLALFPSWDGSEEADPTGRLARTLAALAGDRQATTSSSSTPRPPSARSRSRCCARRTRSCCRCRSPSSRSTAAPSCCARW